MENGVQDKTSQMITKYLFAALLILILWGVLQFVKLQISDREDYMQQTLDEVGSTWSTAQLLGGPVIMYDRISYDSLTVKSSKGRDSLVLKKKEKTFALYPENMDVKCNVDNKNLHRAIYDVNVYNANVDFSGNYIIPDNFFDGSVQNIKVRMSVSDLKGIYEQVYFNLDTAKYLLNPDFSNARDGVVETVGSDDLEEILSSSIGRYDRDKKKDKSPKLGHERLISPISIAKGSSNLPFKLNLAIKGTNSLSFYPVGDATTVEIKSKYKDPSFKGDFLPIDRTVTEDGFSAIWKVLKINRNNPYKVKFGVELIQPVTQYQKSDRSTKYGIFIIILVFLAGIVVELITKRNINILQYSVIGLSLVLFYLLLLSFSDFISFGLAYLIASVMTTVALTAYFRGILKHKSAYILGGLVFLFFMISLVMMQMQVYSLLTGSMILFVILCVIMYLTRNMSPSADKLENSAKVNK